MSRIKPTDTIKGALYLDFMREYREYDKKQKKIILQLQDRIEALSQIVEEMRPYNEGERKYFNQAELIINLQRCLRKLKIKNQQLTEENQMLKLKLGNNG